MSWPNLLKDRCKAKYQADVTIVSPAIGGTELRQNVVLIPRWLVNTPEPDLVTIFFGGNDWSNGMRGEQFLETSTEAVDRVRKATKGKADVLLLTTAPSAMEWETMAELSEACREAAKNKNAGLADVEKAFHVADKKNRDRLYVSDRVHLGSAGHEVVAETVLQAIEAAVGEGRAVPASVEFLTR